jgi:dolichol-phosphate mannosyltransferase
MITFVVMPVANEEATIEALLTGVLSQGIGPITVLPVMDGFSKDNTLNLVENFQKRDPRVQLVFHEASTGVVSCYLRGFREAVKQGADYIIEMDGGGSHDPAEIPDFIRLLDGGNDCVFSSRFMKGGGMVDQPFKRRLISWAGTIVSNLVLGTKLSDMTSGYEAFRGSVLRAIDEKIGFDNILSLRKASHFIQTELRYYCARLTYAEKPIVYKGSTSTLRNETVVNSFKALFALKGRPQVLEGDLRRESIGRYGRS